MDWVRRGVLGAVGGILALPGAASAATFTVSSTGDPVGASCNATSHTCTSLRAATLDTPAGSTIQLGSGDYTLALGALSIGQSETIAGAGSAQTKIDETVNGQDVLNATAGALVLQDLTITGGRNTPTSGAEDQAGGVVDTGSSLTLERDAVTGNRSTGAQGANVGSGLGGPGADAIGGVEIGGHSVAVTIDRTVISGNVATAGNGGSGTNGGGGGTATAGLWDQGSPLTISDSVISGNVGTAGSGGSASGATHTGGGSGQAEGAIDLIALGTTTITGTTVSGNQSIGGNGGAGSGGAKGGNGNEVYAAGLSTVNGTLRFLSSTVSGNSALGSSGGNATGGGNGGDAGTVLGVGLSLSNGAVVVNTTITNNKAAGGAGGTGKVAGSRGDSEGGGLFQGSTAALTLASDTVNANAAGSGANLWLDGTKSGARIEDTIVAGGVGSSGTTSCAITGPKPVDGGHNVESTTPSQCNLSAAQDDLIGADPRLAPLADNGGPAMTEALGLGSPALAAGGACTDPSAAGSPPLAVDERGLHRAAICDVGAFQSELPVNVGAPTISGRFAWLKQLQCAPGAWTGDGLSFSYQWLRAGRPIAGATKPAYSIGVSDFGPPLACRVTAAGSYGTASAIATVASPHSCACAPRISKVSESHKRWRLSGGPPVGTTFRFTLDRAAQVQLAFRRGGRRYVVTVKGRRGHNVVRFGGRISKQMKLKPGRYTLTITATIRLDGNPSSTAKALRFTILG